MGRLNRLARRRCSGNMVKAKVENCTMKAPPISTAMVLDDDQDFLVYLKQMPFTKIKIEPSVVRAAALTGRSQSRLNRALALQSQLVGRSWPTV